MKQTFSRLAYLFLCALLLLSLVACGKEPAETQPTTDPTEATDQTEHTDTTEITKATDPTDATEATVVVPKDDIIYTAITEYFTIWECTLQEKLTSSSYVTDQYKSSISPILESDSFDVTNIVPELQELSNDRAIGVMNYIESCDFRILSWNTSIGEPTNVVTLENGEVSCEVYVGTGFEWYNLDYPEPIKSGFGTLHTLTLNSDFKVVSDLFDERDTSGINTRH